MFGKAIFDGRTEILYWTSSQRNVNEGELGTQVKQQLQVDTVCAVRVSCCKFGSTFFQNCTTARTAVGLFVPDLFVYSTLLPGGWGNISV